MIHIHCPNCRELLDLDDAAAGTMRKCPACQATFPFPEVDAPEVEFADEDGEESGDFEVVEEDAEEAFTDFEIVDESDQPRRASRPHRRKRKRRARPAPRVPIYMQDDESHDMFSGMFTGQKIFGLALMGLGLLNCYGTLVMAGKAVPAMVGGLACGVFLVAGGAYLFLTGD
jgi:hypothetical protein